ncbi:hypothetical protein CsatB_003137 [Cannabis sativa]
MSISKCKLVDVRNSCWTYKQFTTDIQTRQYRCPEVIFHSKYSTSTDLWSFACICFELATGDVLFDPNSGDNYDRDVVCKDVIHFFLKLFRCSISVDVLLPLFSRYISSLRNPLPAQNP